MRYAILFAGLVLNSQAAVAQNIQALLKGGCEVAGAQLTPNTQVIVILNCKKSLRFDATMKELGTHLVLCVTKPGFGTTPRVGTEACTEVE